MIEQRRGGRSGALFAGRARWLGASSDRGQARGIAWPRHLGSRRAVSSV